MCHQNIIHLKEIKIEISSNLIAVAAAKAVPFMSGKIERASTPKVPATIEPPAAIIAMLMQIDNAEVWSITETINSKAAPIIDKMLPILLVNIEPFKAINFTDDSEKITKVAIVLA